MARPPIGVPLAPGWKPAGYLPAPKQARFISEAEQAAEKLPPTIKAQSLKNALLKGGAKPLELEYAGIDDFIGQNQGKPVSAADVLSHLRTEGPLGKLKRVEQQVENNVPIVQGEVAGGWEPGDPPWDTYDVPSELPVGAKTPVYAPDVRKPFDPRTASNQTRYEAYTVPGKLGDFTGYREVLLEDPKNREPGSRGLIRPPKPPRVGEVDMGPEAQAWREQATLELQHLDAYFDDNPGPMNDLVQQAGERGLHLARADDGTPRFDFGDPPASPEETNPIDAHRADYWARYNEYPDRIAVQNIQSDVGQKYTKSDSKGRDSLGAMNSLNEALRNNNVERRAIVEQLNSPSLSPEQRSSLQFELDGLNNEVAEVVANNEGRFLLDYTPEGDEFFSGLLSPPPASPLTKEGNWKNLMARHIALQSINGGGKPITIPTGKQMVDVEGFGMSTHGNEGQAANAANDFNTDLVRRLQKIFRGLHPDGADVMEHLPSTPTTPLSTYAESDLFREIGGGQRRLRHSIMEAGGGGYSGYTRGLEDLKAKRPADFQALEALTFAINATNGGDRQATRLLKSAVQSGQLSPEYRDVAMRVIQQFYLNKERGLYAEPETPPASSTPGWTIKPSPTAVRQALEKGLPIMSLLPLLLGQPEKK